MVVNSDDVFTFTLPPLAAAELYSPLGIIEYQRVVFSFEELEWVEMYDIEIYSNDQTQLLWTVSSSTPYYQVDLGSLDAIEPNNTYYWRVVARSDTLDCAVESAFAQLHFKQIIDISFRQLPSSLEENSVVSWEALTNAASYELYVGSDPVFRSKFIPRKWLK